MGYLTKLKGKIKDGFLRSINKRPVYRLDENGIHREYKSLNEIENLPYDKSVGVDNQLFLGDYANVWEVDFQAIKDEYGEFGQDEPISNLIKNKHVIPNQKYKEYMNNKVLNNTFNAQPVKWERLQYLLYGLLAAVGIDLLVTLT